MLIGIAGRKGAGKSTAADMALAILNARQKRAAAIAFADPMKRFVAEVFDWPMEDLNGASERKELMDKRYPRPNATKGPEYLTQRYALQGLGTDWGRDCYENIWVQYGIRKAQQYLQQLNYDAVIITDVRFENEADAIRKTGGRIIHIRRQAPTGVAPDSHSSEAGIAYEHQDISLENNGSLRDLESGVEWAINILLKPTRPRRFYIATNLDNAAAHAEVHAHLRDTMGFKITYDWTAHGSVQHRPVTDIGRVAERELEGVSQADFVVVLLPGDRGTHAELGMACMASTPVFLFSETGEEFKSGRGHSTCAFYHLPNVHKVTGNFAALYDRIQSWHDSP